MTAKTDSTLAEQSARAKHNEIQSTQAEEVKNADNTIQIRPLTLADREILLGMYRTFEPLCGAQGLPPRVERLARLELIGRCKGKSTSAHFRRAGISSATVSSARQMPARPSRASSSTSGPISAASAPTG